MPTDPKAAAQTPAASHERRFKVIDEVRAPVRKQPLTFLSPRKIAAKLHAAAQVAGGYGRALAESFLVKGTQPGLVLLAVVTAVYLLLEFAFSAWLLDVMAASFAQGEVDRVEHVGRLISGFGVSLLFWPWALRCASGPIRRIFLLAAVTLPAMWGVYHAERALIDYLVATSTPEQRAAAVTGSLLRQGIVTGSVTEKMLDGLWNESTSQSTAGKAFVGVVAFMAASSSQALQQTMALAPALVRDDIDRRTGGVSSEYARYKEGQDSIRSQYDAYVRGQKEFSIAISKAGERANQAWEDYLDALTRRHNNWGRTRVNRPFKNGELAPLTTKKSIIKAIRKQGINVPDNWNTGDKATFVARAKEAYELKARAQFTKKLGGLREGMSLAQFAADPSIQRRWRNALGYSSSVMLAVSTMSEKQFASQIYPSILSSRTKEQLTVYQAKADTYGEGQERSKEGAQAFEAMIAPVFALTLSLIGALVHAAKTMLLAVQLRTGWHFRSGWHKTSAILLVVIFTFVLGSKTISTELTSHETYTNWTSKGTQVDFQSISAVRGAFTSAALDSMIKLQSIAYPAFNVVRNQLLPILDFAQGTSGKASISNLVSDDWYKLLLTQKRSGS